MTLQTAKKSKEVIMVGEKFCANASPYAQTILTYFDRNRNTGGSVHTGYNLATVSLA